MYNAYRHNGVTGNPGYSSGPSAAKSPVYATFS